MILNHHNKAASLVLVPLRLFTLRLRTCLILLLGLIAFSPASQGAGASSDFAPRTVRGADGVTLSYSLVGTADRVLLVLHGGPGLGSQSIMPDLLSLAFVRKLLFLDQRGSGLSDRPNGESGFAIERYVEDLEAVRAGLGVESWDLLGHSWGAALAAHYAKRFPERTGKLILISPMPLKRTPFMDQFSRQAVAWMTDEEKTELGELRRHLPTAENPGQACINYWRLNIRSYLARPREGRFPSSSTPCTGHAENIRLSQETLRLTLGALGDWDWQSDFTTIQSEALVIAGRQDPQPLASAELWAATLKNSALLELDSAGHFPHIDAPSTVQTHIVRFLGGFPKLMSK